MSSGRTVSPATFVAFDILAIDGEAVTHRPWCERRRLLEGLALGERAVATRELRAALPR
jgi:ATP-dependent DNA ligase